MTDDQRAKAGDPLCAHTADGGSPVTPRQRRMTAQRKQDAVLRVLRGEDLELVSRDIGLTAADLSGWRDSFLEAGATSLKSRAKDGRDRTIQALHAKVGEITMANELLEAKIDRLEAGQPFRHRRLKMSQTWSVYSLDLYRCQSTGATTRWCSHFCHVASGFADCKRRP